MLILTFLPDIDMREVDDLQLLTVLDSRIESILLEMDRDWPEIEPSTRCDMTDSGVE